MKKACLTLLLLLGSTCSAQTLSTSWGWKSSDAVFGDVAVSVPVYRHHRSTYSGTAAYSHTFGRSDSVLFGAKRTYRWKAYWALFQQVEMGVSHRHCNDNLALQVTGGTSYHATRTVDFNFGVKVNKTVSVDPYFTLYAGVSKRFK